MKVEGGGRKVDRALSAAIVLSKFSELVSEPLTLDNSVSGVVASNDSEFKTVDLEGRLFSYSGLLLIVLSMS